MPAIVAPLPQFFDLDGRPLQGGAVYIGTPDLNPETTPVDVFWDAALTQPAQQPLRTQAGALIRNGTMAQVYTAGDYSMLVKNAAGSQVLYARNAGDYSLSQAVTALDARITGFGTSDGAAQVGRLWTRDYVARTIGNDLRYGSIPSIFQVLSDAQQADVLAYGFTLDLYNTIANAYALCKTWYFPAGGYKLTNEIPLVSGTRFYGDGNADTAFGAQTTTNKPTRFWQATAGKAVFTIGGGVSDFVVADMSLSAVQTPAAYVAPTIGKYGVKFSGEAYNLALQPAGRSTYRGLFQRISFYGFERGISVVDQHWEVATPPAGFDWQADSVHVNDCHTWNCLHGYYFNTTNADAWNFTKCTSMLWTNGTGLYLKRSGYIKADSCYFIPGEATAGVFAIGNVGIYVGDYYDNLMLVNCQAESLAYFLDVDATTGYENVYNQITLQGCIVEAPIRVRRKAKIVSIASRYTQDVTCSGDDVEAHSTADSWFPTTKKFLMTGLRSRLFVDPGSTQTSGTLATTTAVAATAFTLPATAGMYSVYAYIASAGVLYMSTARIGCDGATLLRMGGENAANLTITVSGLNVQVTQASGVGQTVSYSFHRVG